MLSGTPMAQPRHRCRATGRAAVCRQAPLKAAGRWAYRRLLPLLLPLLLLLALAWPQAALAGRLDDGYDGNIFALYAGDGALVPPRNSLKEDLQRHRPVVLAFYLDDSRDCKRFAPVLSTLGGEFGAVADVIALSSDGLGPRGEATAEDPAFYWRGMVPQVVILDKQGEVVLDQDGQVPLDVLEQSLAVATEIELPESILQRQTRAMDVNEINSELVTVNPS